MSQTTYLDGAEPMDDEPNSDGVIERMPFAERLAIFLAVVLPVIGLATAIALLWGRGIGWLEVSLFAVMYVVTAMGVTVGYHRLFTHQSFGTPTWVQAFFAIAGSMSVQGSVLTWTAVHRLHHQHSDHEDDPHSPHHHGGGVKGVLLGLWHSHVGWLFKPHKDGIERYIPDLLANRTLVVIDRLFPLWVALGLVLPGVIGGIVSGSWMGALLGFLWGGLVRVFFVHHITWSINSVCHVWGTRPFRSQDESRNNVIFGFLGFGEGWHNNHHAFPASARHGLRWWEFDLSYLLIRAMEMVGLAWKVNLPSPDRIEKKKATPAPTQS